MALFKKINIVAVLLITTLAVGLMSCAKEDTDKPKPAQRALSAAVDTCDGITERAAAHLVAVVEFQKLEIAGRKARVFKMCMQDRGYIENSQWLKHSRPIAEKVAKETNVSKDEALENLRRANMMAVATDPDRPSYWVLPQ